MAVTVGRLRGDGHRFLRTAPLQTFTTARGASLFSLALRAVPRLSRGVPKIYLYLSLVLVTASWGAVLPVLRQINAVREGYGVSAWDIVWLRLVPGAFLFLPLLAVRRRESVRLFRQAWFPILLVGLCTTSLYNFFLVTGEERIPASLAALVIGVNPSVAFALSAVFLGEAVTWRKVVGMILSLAGLAYISNSGKTESGGAVDPYYLLLTVMAPIAFSVGTVASKRMLRDVDPLTITAATIVAGAAPLLPLPFFQGNLIAAAPLLPAWFWWAIAFMVIVPLVIGYIVWYMALEKLDAGQASAFVFLVPVFGVALSSFNEPLTTASLIGGCIILFGVALTAWNPSRGKSPSVIDPVEEKAR